MSELPEDLARIAQAVAEIGYGVAEDFLPAETVRALGEELRQAWEAGSFRPAGVGAAAARRPEVRGDHILWLDPPAASPAHRSCLERFERLRLALNRELQLGLFDFECHFARYPPGAFYRRHRDRLSGDERRTLSCVLYLNQDWRAEEGGALRLYVPSGDSKASADLPPQLDLLPQGGTLAVFLSDRFEHEVLPARRERLSLTGWFLRRG
jgi:SM-20-related protein